MSFGAWALLAIVGLATATVVCIAWVLRARRAMQVSGLGYVEVLKRIVEKERARATGADRRDAAPGASGALDGGASIGSDSEGM